ncbi:putative ribonuclease H-like domain-containing protein [Tanacetum coccineum]
MQTGLIVLIILYLDQYNANVNTVRANVNSVRQNVNSVRTNINNVRSKQLVPTNNTNRTVPVTQTVIVCKTPHVNKFNQQEGNGATAVKTSVDHPLKEQWRTEVYLKGCSLLAHDWKQGITLYDFERMQRGFCYFWRFSWVFFLATKDETSGILQHFIRQIENQLNQMVKIIRSDNGIEFKNRDMLEFCGNKGIKQEYSNARTPQQNGKQLVLLAISLIGPTNSAGTLQTPIANVSEEEDKVEELIVVPTAVKQLAENVGQRKSYTNSKADEFLTELQNLKAQEKED